MGGDQKKSDGNNSEGVSAGRIFMKTYKPTPEHQKKMNKFQGLLSVCEERERQLKRNGGSSTRIEEAQREKEKILLQQEVEHCKVALKDENVSQEQRRGVEEYLEKLRMDLKEAGGAEA